MIGKAHFTSLYSPARKTAFTKRNIFAAWAKSGLFPFNPDRVLRDTPRRDTISDVCESREANTYPRLEDLPAAIPRTPVTPVTLEGLVSLQDLISQDAHSLDEVCRRRLRKHLQKLALCGAGKGEANELSGPGGGTSEAYCERRSRCCRQRKTWEKTEVADTGARCSGGWSTSGRCTRIQSARGTNDIISLYELRRWILLLSSIVTYQPRSQILEPKGSGAFMLKKICNYNGRPVIIVALIIPHV